MCVCVWCMSMCVCSDSHPYQTMWRPKADARTSFPVLLLLIVWRGSLLNLFQLDWLPKKHLGFECLCPRRRRGSSCVHACTASTAPTHQRDPHINVRGPKAWTDNFHKAQKWPGSTWRLFTRQMQAQLKVLELPGIKRLIPRYVGETVKPLESRQRSKMVWKC